MRVLIVADDLTGALDSAVMLAIAGLRTVVARRPADVAAALASGPEVLAVSTASREGDGAAARDAVTAAVDAVAGATGGLPEILFKKVDSRLKGHAAAETAALAARAGRGSALVAPAIPAQGRFVTGGRLDGRGVTAAIDVAGALAGSGLALAVPDTHADADLDAALASALDGRGAAGDRQPLLVGAAGLAAAVARRLAPGAPRPAPRALAAPLLLAIGSRDPITVAQIEQISGRADVAFGLAPDGACPRPAIGVRAQAVRLVAAEGAPFDPARAGPRFAAEIAQLVTTGGFATLLGCGGETADAILGALGVGQLHIEGEALPGAPVSGMLVGGRSMQLVTKSGGFGDVNALASIVDAAREGPR